jgi:hypothetical protein
MSGIMPRFYLCAARKLWMPVPTTNLQIKFEFISNLEFCGRQTSNIIGIIKKKIPKKFEFEFQIFEKYQKIWVQEQRS